MDTCVIAVLFTYLTRSAAIYSDKLFIHTSRCLLFHVIFFLFCIYSQRYISCSLRMVEMCHCQCHYTTPNSNNMPWLAADICLRL